MSREEPGDSIPPAHATLLDSVLRMSASDLHPRMHVMSRDELCENLAILRGLVTEAEDFAVRGEYDRARTALDVSASRLRIVNDAGWNK